MTPTVRLELPAYLCRLASAPTHITLAVEGPVTLRTILDALEAAYPALEGTLRDHSTKLRRPFIRFFAAQEDLSHLNLDEPLPEPIACGTDPLCIVGAIAGG